MPRTATSPPRTIARHLSVILTLMLAAAPPCRAQEPPAAAVAEQLRTLLSAAKHQDTIGLAVANTADGELWFAHQANTPLKPASVQKLFITAAALQHLGTDFKYRTRAYAHNDELWIVAAGDPALDDQRIAQRNQRPTNEFISRLVQALQARQTTTISKIVLDDSIFDHQGRHPDWPADQADRWYQAPAGGFNINDNCLDVIATLRHKHIELDLTPDLPAALIDNRLTIGRKHNPTISRPPGGDIFQLRGTLNKTATLMPVSAGRPTIFFAHTLKQALQSGGITPNGSVVRRKLTPTELAAADLLVTKTTELPDVIWRCNNFSQNLFAECLMKSLAAYQSDGSRAALPASWDTGRDILRTTLRELNLDTSTATFRDGSGLSHSNRVTAGQIVRLLVTMRRHRHADVFVGSLAQPGKPGSLRKRYNDPLLEGRLRAKTGTIAGVRALAGYVTRPDGTELAFALLINAPGNRQLPTQVCKTLAATGTSPPQP